MTHHPVLWRWPLGWPWRGGCDCFASVGLQVIVDDATALIGCINAGKARRATSATFCNASSSRSHAVLRLTVQVAWQQPAAESPALLRPSMPCPVVPINALPCCAHQSPVAPLSPWPHPCRHGSVAASKPVGSVPIIVATLRSILNYLIPLPRRYNAVMPNPSSWPPPSPAK